MASLPGLPSLPTLDAAAQSAEQAAVNATSAVNQAVASGLNTATGGFYGWLTGGNGILVILGILLIAAGIFSFDKARALIVKGGEAAAVAA